MDPISEYAIPQDNSKPQFSTDTDFNLLPFNFEIQLGLDIIADKFNCWYCPQSKLELYIFLRDKISGEARKYFVSQLFKNERTQEEFMQVILKTNNELITA